MPRIPSRLLGASTAAVLVAAGLAATTAPAHAATPRTDPVPGAAAAAWLTGQLTDGLIHNDQYAFDDVGLSIDVALGLDELGGHTSTVATIGDAVAGALPGYIGDGTSEAYAGPTAKALVLAQIAGADPTTYGGVDLVSRLEGLVTPSGRIQDTSQYGDYANVLGQSLAARGLAVAGSDESAPVTGFLLEQQCSPGWFRVDFSDPTAADQTCDGDTASVADTDATAYAVINLQGQRSQPAVKTAIAHAATWLVSAQHADGSFGGSGPTSAANANSTGLAGYALKLTGHGAAATSAAVWVRQHQLAGIGVCQPYVAPDRGALAYDQTALVAARKRPIVADTQDQYRRATAQALPLLAFAPAAPRSGGGGASGQQFYRPGASTVSSLFGAAPGSPVCGYVGGEKSGTLVVTDAHGDASVRVTLPKVTGSYSVHTRSEDSGGSSRPYVVLGRLVVPFRLAHGTVAAGGKQTVRVHGLAAHESVRATYRGRVVARGQVGSNGRATLTFPVLAKRGTFPVRVTGEYGDIRRNTKSFTVTR